MTSGCFLGWRVCLVIFSDVSFLVRALVGSFQASSSVAVTIGHSISKRRPVDLTAEQAASISFSPHIMRLSRRVETLRGQAKHSGKAMDEYKKAYGELRSEKQSMRRRLKQQIRGEWTDKQAVLDIEAQLSGLSFADVPPVEVPGRPIRPAQELLSTRIVLSHLVLATGSHQHQPMLACQPACCVPASVPAGGACLPALRASQYSVPASVPASLYQQDQLAFRLLYNSLTSSLPEVIIQVILLIHCPR